MVFVSNVLLFGVLSSFVAARPRPDSIGQADLVKEKVGAKIIQELARNQDKIPNAVARQLLGGGDDYAPYEVPCPSDMTWIRPADVSFFLRLRA